MPSDARISTALPAHPKFKKIIRRLGDSGGLRVLLLFLWAAANRPDGDLNGMTDEDIEIAVDWPGEPGAFAKALVSVGFLDGAERSYSIHDWAVHQPWAAGSEERSEASRWASLCRRYGKIGAAERMPEYAERQRIAREAQENGSGSHAAGRNPHCPVSNPDSTPGSDTDPVSVSVSVSDTDSDTDPTGRVAPRLALAPPPAGRSRREGSTSKTGPAWSAYAAAYAERYAVDPVRNAKSSALLSQLVDRIGAEDAPYVAAYYVRNNSAYYVARGHSLQCLVADAEKLRTEWATKRQITGAEARQIERTQTTADVFGALLKEGAHVER